MVEEKKLIITDADNTLWYGVIGEEDVRCHEEYQEFLIEKKRQGFLICLCSKNNEADIKKELDRIHHPLSWDDIIIKKVNWKQKPDNILEIAEELSLHPSSFIFTVFHQKKQTDKKCPQSHVLPGCKNEKKT